MLDIAVGTNLKAKFFATLPNADNLEYLKAIIDDPFITFGVSDGGAHTRFLTAGRYPTEALTKVPTRAQYADIGRGSLALVPIPHLPTGFNRLLKFY